MLLNKKLYHYFSKLNQKRNERKRFARMKTFVQNELKVIEQIHLNASYSKKGTVIVKCDDIGDFLVWQQVIERIKQEDAGPLFFVGNTVLKNLYETFFDFADKTIWVDKSKWDDAAYRLSIYKEVNALNAQMAYTTLFTRNFMMDDLIVQASGADTKIAWDRSHHNRFPQFEYADKIFTKTIRSNKPILLEYERNIEFIASVYGLPEDFQIRPLFPNFTKHNVLIVVPIASSESKTWKAEKFANVIQSVLQRFDRIILIGGANGIAAADKITEIVRDPKLVNLVNQLKLNELFQFVGEARVLLTLDTFAAHMGVLCATDTIEISNGTLWLRFANYASKIQSKFELILPPDMKRDFSKDKLYYNRSEINSISEATVINAFSQLMDLPGER